jgi:hypothetical protein
MRSDVPRKEFVDAADRVLCDALEDILEISLRFNAA